MKKFIILFAAIMSTACSTAVVESYQIDELNEKCETHGGVHRINAHKYVSSGLCRSGEVKWSTRVK